MTTNQNFISCEGIWSVNAGVPTCQGQLKLYTADEMVSLLTQGETLTTEESNQLIEGTLLLFATVFAFLIIRKAIF